MHSCQKRFDAHLLDLSPHLLRRLVRFLGSMIIDVVKNGIQTSLMSDIIHKLVLILDESLGLFIYRIVSQMHAQILQVVPAWALVLFCCEPSQAFLVNETPQRIAASY